MSSTATPQAPPTENIYGIAKRISLDLEKLPLHTHAAIISVINTMCQHRKLVLETEMNAQQFAAQEAAMAEARKAHAEQAARREQQIADTIKAHASESKPPRLTVVLDKPEEQKRGTMDDPAYARAHSDATGFSGVPSEADLDTVEAEKAIAAATAGCAEVAVS
jgi:hypothetical protein